MFDDIELLLIDNLIEVFDLQGFCMMVDGKVKKKDETVPHTLVVNTSFIKDLK